MCVSVWERERGVREEIQRDIKRNKDIQTHTHTLIYLYIYMREIERESEVEREKETTDR